MANVRGKFAKRGAVDQAVEPTEVVGLSPFQLGVARLRRDRVAVIGFWVIVVFVFVAVFAPIIVKIFGLDPYKLDRSAINDYGLPKGPFGGVSWNHPLGVEPGTGRDILGRLIYGARISLLVGTIGTILTTSVGLVLGMIAGLRRGIVDAIISRLGDITLAFPSLLLLIALNQPFTQRLVDLGVPRGNTARLTYILLVLMIFGWVYVARLVRGQVLSLREREFIEAARSFGAPNRHIIFKELLPNLQSRIPTGSLSRVFSYDALGSNILVPLGLVIAGPLAAQTSPSTALLAGSVIAVIATLMCFSAREVRHLPEIIAAEN